MAKPGSGRWPQTRVELTAEERTELERIARLRVAPYREVTRAKALLMAADGHRNEEIARNVGVTARTVYNWRWDFQERRLESLCDRTRTGRPRRFSPGSPSGSSPHCLPEARGRDHGSAPEVIAPVG